MTNAELFSKDAELKAAHDAFREVAKDFTEYYWVRRVIADPYFFAVKPADTALQAGLKVGAFVKIMVNLHGEGMYPHYAVVVKTHVSDADSECVKCDKVLLRFANGSCYNFRVENRIGTPLSDETQMKSGDIKECDIPDEVLNLTLYNCHLKNKDKVACMKIGTTKEDEHE